ncbi:MULTISPECIES: hypothetical protein [Halolamina]|uniref:DUF8060 domain-containing protein n=1 Tax=Halolamina pelagica TaxID=699431 RepID=A0A1I5M6G2_9EURY|nr:MULTISPECIES: hypothetical protein [Halolamina]NHX35885.1 hypothetical protein [Halolamina sp. R1-12]SFP05090.1 hypothetical protein SAMN05216277_101123 [Halolamina pelagica]
MSEDERPDGVEDPTDDRSRTEDTMTDTADDDDGAANREPEEGPEQDEGRDLRRTLNYVLLAGLSLLALIATLQLYLNVSSAINQWISHEYRSLFQAAFNLVVLLLVGTAMVWQVRRLRE